MYRSENWKSEKFKTLQRSPDGDPVSVCGEVKDLPEFHSAFQWILAESFSQLIIMYPDSARNYRTLAGLQIFTST